MNSGWVRSAAAAGPQVSVPVTWSAGSQPSLMTFSVRCRGSPTAGLRSGVRASPLTVRSRRSRPNMRRGSPQVMSHSAAARAEKT